MQLPNVIPIFPLPNVVLFPGVPLPLHIFEPRYRSMVRDAAAGRELIGMVLLRGDWHKDYCERADVFETGCAGKLINTEALPDGRFNIVLQGIRTFTVTRELTGKDYREVEVSWRAPESGSLDATMRQILVDRLGDLLQATPESSAHRLLRDRSLSDQLLVNFFCYALDISPLEKQGLLHQQGLQARAEQLREVVEFRLEERRYGLPRSDSERRH
jgi:Lon protease-like protein